MVQIEHLSATLISGRHYMAVEADARFTALRRSKAISRPLSLIRVINFEYLTMTSHPF